MTGLSLINDTIIARSLEDKGRSYLDPAMFVIQGNPASQNGARRNDGGRGTREDLAERLDIELRRLSRALTMLDVLQGKLLSEIKKKGGEILGYTRILNYAREELGIGERSAQDLLRMESLFPKFPLFKAAYEKGELSRSKVKLLLRYLTPEDEGMWLENATGWSVRMLEDCLRLYKSTLSELLASRATGEPAENVSGEAPGVIAPANGPDETSIAEEAAQGPKSLAKGEAPESGANGKTSQKKAREWAAEQACLKSQEPATCSPVLDDEDDVGEWISIPASGRLHEKWRRFLEIGRRMEGKDLPPWAAVEYACADFLSGAPLQAITGESEKWRGTSLTGESDGGCVASNVKSSDTCSDRGWWRELMARLRKRRIEAAEEDERTLLVAFDGWSFLSWDAPEIELPDEWQSFPQDVREMHEMLKDMRFFKAKMHHALICLLGTFKNMRLFWDLEFGSFGHYAKERLGMPPSTAYRYAAMSREFSRFPALVAAIQENVLCLEKARLCGKVSFDFKDEIWIPYAKMLPTVRLRLVVEILEDLKCEFPHTFRRLYDALPSLLIQCEQNGDRELSGIRSLIGETEALRVMGRNREVPEFENKNWSGDENENDRSFSMCASVHEATLIPPSPLKKNLSEAPAENVARESDIPPPEVLAQGVIGKKDTIWPIKFYLPADLVGLWERTIRTVRRMHGESWSLAECLEILVESFLRDHENEDEKKEHAVIERDGWRCTVPGCGSRWNLHVHHIEYRSQGGTDEPENETTVCMSCHQRAIHKGYIKVTGSAPGNLVWEIGVSPIHPQIAGYVNGLRVAA